MGLHGQHEVPLHSFIRIKTCLFLRRLSVNVKIQPEMSTLFTRSSRCREFVSPDCWSLD